MKDQKIVKRKMFVHVSNWTADGVTLDDIDMSTHGYPLLGETEVSFIMPTKDPVLAKIELLQKQLNDHYVAAEAKTTKIKEEIQSLLCIENAPDLKEMPKSQHYAETADDDYSEHLPF